MIRFGIVGSGWRAQFYLRIARELPDCFEISGIVTRKKKVAELSPGFQNIKFFNSIHEMVQKTAPSFTVTSVPQAVNVRVIESLTHENQPILSETPPAETIAELERLFALETTGARVQVAEQYHLQPHHAASIAFCKSGKLGKINEAHVSAAHGYHGVSLIRRFLDLGFENTSITTTTFTAPVTIGPGRSGPPENDQLIESTRSLAWLDFGDQLGIYDFVADQYFSPIRNNFTVVRGTKGELSNNHAIYLQDYLTPVKVPIERIQAGTEGDLEGHFLKGYQIGEQWLYKNPLTPGRLTDDEIAVGNCLIKMHKYSTSGVSFYSLSEACQDRYLDIMIAESQKKKSIVKTQRQIWAK